MDSDVIPIVDVRLGCLDEFQFFFRIVYQGTQLASLSFANVALEQFGHLASDVSGGILQYVLEGSTLTVQVG